jgi:hypothetical protein
MPPFGGIKNLSSANNVVCFQFSSGFHTARQAKTKFSSTPTVKLESTKNIFIHLYKKCKTKSATRKLYIEIKTDEIAR